MFSSEQRHKRCVVEMRHRTVFYSMQRQKGLKQTKRIIAFFGVEL